MMGCSKSPSTHDPWPHDPHDPTTPTTPRRTRAQNQIVSQIGTCVYGPSLKTAPIRMHAALTVTERGH